MSWQDYKQRRRRWRKVMLVTPIAALVLTGLGMMAYITADARGVDVPAPGLVMAGAIGLMIIETVTAVVCAFRYVMVQENFAMESHRRNAARPGHRRRPSGVKLSQKAKLTPRPEEPQASEPASSTDEPAPQPAAVKPKPKVEVHHAETLRVPESMVIDDPIAAEQ